MEIKTVIDKQFAKHVHDGLNAKEKNLSSKYFYDKRGSELFVEIMNCDDYYVTDAEMEIFSLQANDIVENFSKNEQPFNVVELGAGDGSKTIHLLKALKDQKRDFVYKPMDISSDAVENLEIKLKSNYPEIRVNGVIGDYFEKLADKNNFENIPKVILFVGSNLGNMTEENAISFLNQLNNCMNVGDQLLLGLDLKKEPSKILAAYNDTNGYTAQFNLNLLNRINNELGGNFNLENWQHSPIYEPKLGRAISYLVSRCEQEVFIEANNESYQFDAWETIHTEISQKYDGKMIQNFADKCGFNIQKKFTDSNKYFTDILLIKS